VATCARSGPDKLCTISYHSDMCNFCPSRSGKAYLIEIFDTDLPKNSPTLNLKKDKHFHLKTASYNSKLHLIITCMGKEDLLEEEIPPHKYF
jgi:hypothetical protein